MDNLFLSLLISMISGLSTMIGFLIIFIKNNNKNKIIYNSLIFSSFIMLFISISDLIPNSFSLILRKYNIFFSIMLIITYILFGFIIVEIINDKNKSKSDLYKIGIVSTMAMVMHNLPEGIITFITTTKDVGLGINLAISIALHNIPEGISIAIPIYYSTKSKFKAFLYTFIAAIVEPIGALLSLLFINKINDYLFGIILSVTSGIMIYLSIFDLLKEARKYLKKREIVIKYLLIFIIILFIKIITK